jgi:hypothetical protein
MGLSMRKLTAAIYFALAFSVAAQTGMDLSDRVLVSYQLTADEGAQFSSTDGKLTDFWSNWDSQKLDYIIEVPSVNGFTSDAIGWTGENDAQ